MYRMIKLSNGQEVNYDYASPQIRQLANEGKLPILTYNDAPSKETQTTAVQPVNPPPIRVDDTIISSILGGQMNPSDIDSYIKNQVFNQYKSTYGDARGTDAFNLTGQSAINSLKSQLEGKTFSYGGQRYQINNGSAVKLNTTVNKSVVTGQGITSNTGSQYLIKAGDTLSKIAQQNGISLQQLLQQNPQFQTNPNLIQPGQVINLGGQAPATNEYVKQFMVDNPQYGYNGTPNPTTDAEMSANLINLQNQTGLISANLLPTSTGFVDKYTGQIYTNAEVADDLSRQIADATVKSGFTIDPKMLELTSWKDFMDEAGKILDPYYTSKFETIKNTVKTKLSQLGEDLGLKTADLQRTSEENLQTGRNTLAERGLSFSGQRNTFDTRTQEELNRAVAAVNTGAYRSGQDLVSEAEGQIGTANLQGINTNLGGRSLSLSSTPLYGDLPYQRYGYQFNTAQALATDQNARNALSRSNAEYAYNLSKNSV